MGEQARAVAALRRSLVAQRGGAPVEALETHISFVLLAGPVVYKVKKAVDLGFLDFSTLARRCHFCNEELRLNRRLAPALYLGVVAITGPADAPAIDGPGPVIDWAVKMQAFAQADLWDALATRQALGPEHIDALVPTVCAFHEGAARAQPGGQFGDAADVRAPMLDNLRVLDDVCMNDEDRMVLAALRRWEQAEFDALRGIFAQRLAQGWVRECHGDLHLGNITQVEGRPTAFDCLEFNPSLRWTDVTSDLAFLAMDLRSHGLDRLAQRFLNACIERSGDHAGLRTLRYYTVYRALVRAKVAALRDAQTAAGITCAAAHCLGVAHGAARRGAAALILTHGFSGSGKTVQTQSLLELCGAIRLRADVERKRLFGLPAMARSDPALQARLYSAQSDEATQDKLRALAGQVLDAGYPVIVDATYLASAHREGMRRVAASRAVPFVIVDFQASQQTLRERVRQRSQRQDDASEADVEVLESQWAHAQPLQPGELAAVFVFDAEKALDATAMPTRWAPLLQRLGGVREVR